MCVCVSILRALFKCSLEKTFRLQFNNSNNFNLMTTFEMYSKYSFSYYGDSNITILYFMGSVDLKSGGGAELGK